MLVLLLQAVAALHFLALVAIIAMMQMDKFDHIRRNLAIALLVTFGSGTGMVFLLEQIQPFIWENTASAAPVKRQKVQMAKDEDDELEDEGGGGAGDAKDGRHGKTVRAGDTDGGATRKRDKAKGSLNDCEQCPEMVVIAGGKFLMGALPDEPGAKPAELPQIPDVAITSFAIGRFEVTREQYLEFSKATNHPLRSTCERADGHGGAVSAVKPGFAVNREQPMVCVTWADALKYASWLSKVSGRTYRLPTAAEWEYAARSGNAYPYHNGTLSLSAGEARIGGQPAGPTAVGSFGPNARGLYDLHGNAGEWVEDCMAPSLKDSPRNGKPIFVSSVQGCDRVVKGGGWHSPSEDARVAARQGFPTSTVSNGIGFRVARDLN